METKRARSTEGGGAGLKWHGRDQILTTGRAVCVWLKVCSPPDDVFSGRAANGSRPSAAGRHSLRPAKACGVHFADSSEFSRGVPSTPPAHQRTRRKGGHAGGVDRTWHLVPTGSRYCIRRSVWLSSRATSNFYKLLRGISMEDASRQALHPATLSSYLDVALAETPDLLAASSTPPLALFQPCARICACGGRSRATSPQPPARIRQPTSELAKSLH